MKVKKVIHQVLVHRMKNVPFSAIDELYDVRYFLLCIVFFAGMLGLTSNEGFLVSSCNDELWPVILTFELDPESAKMNQISSSGVI